MMTKARILVVEDELIVAENLRVTLGGMGYDVPQTACCSEEAIRFVEERPPDLILMDIRLEGSEFDGVETARRIRGRYDIPVVFLTAYADDETLERVKVTEPFAYILKPFNERELYSAIELALHKHHAEQELKKRDNILFALSFAVEWYLRFQKESRQAKAGDPAIIDDGIREVLGQIGFAVNADMVAVFRMNLEQEGNTGAKIQYLWSAPGLSPAVPEAGYEDARLIFTTSLWRSLLASGNAFAGNVKKFPEGERRFFEQCGIMSIAMLPLFREGGLWGFVGFSAATSRDWTDTEMEALTVAGNIVGAVLD
jgi:two-component system, response regulator PdtaR